MGEYFTSGLFCLQRKDLAYEYFLACFFFHEELLTPPLTPKLEDYPLSAVRDCLFNLFAATLHIGGRSSIRNLRARHAVLTGTHKHGKIYDILLKYHIVGYFRYVDDILILYNNTTTNSHEVLTIFTNITPTVKFTMNEGIENKIIFF